ISRVSLPRVKTFRPSPLVRTLFTFGAGLLLGGIAGAVVSTETWQYRTSLLTAMAGCLVCIIASSRGQREERAKEAPRNHR
ncbi:MAG: hypothetical protein ACJ72O_05075, partial [Marmoricola sp.]